MIPLDADAAYRAVAGRDTRWDGRIYLGVTSTGIYCRPSCPARTPLARNCQFFPTAGAAVAAGFRACRRCRPDALPGSRHWDARGDLASRAVRLIADGVLDDVGVQGLARRLDVSERHLHRTLVSEMGASAQQLGQTRRAHAARLLIDQTDLPLTEIAWASGFGSIRQFNEVMRTQYGTAPSALRHQRPLTATATDDGRRSSAPPRLTLQLAYRPPLAFPELRRTLVAHVIDGIERHELSGDVIRTVLAPDGPGRVRLHLPMSGYAGAETTSNRLRVTLELTALTDLTSVVQRVRRWLDLDADPTEVQAHLGADPLIGPLITARSGLRVPGAISASELAICAVLGQQVSLRGARLFQSRVAAAFGEHLGEQWVKEDGATAPEAPPTLLFPTAEALAEAGPQRIRDAANLTRSRARAVHELASAIAGGLALEPGAEVSATHRALTALPGIGPWTADYITLRALRDPDAFMATDLVARKALAHLTETPLPQLTWRAAQTLSQPWRPWRSYALQHLWTLEAYA